MKKRIGILGVSLLLGAMSLNNPTIIASAANVNNCNANENVYSINEIVDTVKILSYEDFCKLYTCKEDVRYVNPAIIEVDQEDAVRLMKIGQSEAGETDPLAMAYVMKVVINRLNDDAFPDTIEEIIKQKIKGRYAFSVVRNGSYDKTEPNVNAHYALYLLESGQINIEAEYFEATWVKNSWQSRNRELEFDYGGHHFYK